MQYGKALRARLGAALEGSSTVRGGSQVACAVQATRTARAARTAQGAQVARTTQAAQVAQVVQATQGAQVARTTQVAQVAQATSAAQVARTTQAAQVAQAMQATQGVQATRSALAKAALAAAFALALAAGPGQAAWAAEGDLAAGGIDVAAQETTSTGNTGTTTNAGTTNNATTNTAAGTTTRGTTSVNVNGESLYRQGSSYIEIGGRTAGKATYNAKTATITLDNVATNASTSRFVINMPGKTVTVKLVGTSTFTELKAYSPLVIDGKGALNANVTVAKGSRLVLAGGTVTGDVKDGKGAVTVSGGKVIGSLTAGDKVTLTAGSITYKKIGATSDRVLTCYNALTVKGGKVAAAGSKYGISVYGKAGKTAKLTQTGGKITIKDATATGIFVKGGNLVLKGGTMSVSGAQKNAVNVDYSTSGGKKIGGKVKIAGGTFRATVTDPENKYAVYAYSMSNKLASTKKIAGLLAPGGSFRAGGNVYKVAKHSYANLASYGASATKVKVNKVKYGKHSYIVSGFAAGAFNTKAGGKVTSIAVNSPYFDTLGAGALSGTKKLESLKFQYSGWYKRNYASDYKTLKSVSVAKGCKVSKTAFANCGKSGGAGLTVAFGDYGIYSHQVSAFTKFLTSRGLSSQATLKAF